MRKHIWILVLLAVVGFELAEPPPAPANKTPINGSPVKPS